MTPSGVTVHVVTRLDPVSDSVMHTPGLGLRHLHPVFPGAAARGDLEAGDRSRPDTAGLHLKVAERVG